jgi:hypothetical protein
MMLGAMTRHFTREDLLPESYDAYFNRHSRNDIPITSSGQRNERLDMMNHDDEGYTRFRENVQSGNILWEEG